MINYRTPYWYQQEAIDAAIKSFAKGYQRILLVAPTGAGKSVIIACFCEQVRKKWGGTKILVISDTLEILLQNKRALQDQLPGEDIGLYSSSANKKIIAPVTVAGIQSIFNKTDLFKGFDLILVDEAHGVSFDLKTRYRKFLDLLRKPTIGLTASPFRMKGGYLHTGKNAYFQTVAYNIRIPVLQKEGKLCQLITKGTKNKLDASNIRKQAGDFVLADLALAFDREEITKRICQELLSYKDSRKKWLGFAIDINHARHIADQLNSSGIKSTALHSGLSGIARKHVIKAYRRGEYQCLTSVAMVTTGFDVKDIDLVFMARPTTSPVLHVQMPGRGMRVSQGKENCLLLDFAGNLVRNGPIDDPKIKDNEMLSKATGEALMKECPNPKCMLIVPIAQNFCSCGHEFQFKHNLTARSSTIAAISAINWYKVEKVRYFVRKNKNGIPYLVVQYKCGLRNFTEPVCLEHLGYARLKARQWWKNRWSQSSDFLPLTCEEAFDQTNFLKTPSEIKVQEGGKYPIIKDYLL